MDKVNIIFIWISIICQQKVSGSAGQLNQYQYLRGLLQFSTCYSSCLTTAIDERQEHPDSGDDLSASALTFTECYNNCLEEQVDRNKPDTDTSADDTLRFKPEQDTPHYDSCASVLASSQASSDPVSYYTITPSHTSHSVPVFCDLHTRGGGWTIIQRNHIISDKNSIISDKDKTISDKNNIIRDNDKVISDNDQIISDNDKILSDIDQIISDKNKDINNKDNILSDKDSNKIELNYNCFNKSWTEYKHGFSSHVDISAAQSGRACYWLGNEYLHRMTTTQSGHSTDYTVRIELVDLLHRVYFAEYYGFRVLGEEEGYRLVIDGFSTGSDTSSADGIYYALLSQNQERFSTFDNRDPELESDCPLDNLGGFWYSSGYSGCGMLNLNGEVSWEPIFNAQESNWVLTEIKFRPSELASLADEDVEQTDEE